MKIFKSLFVSAICVLTLISCSKDHEPQLTGNVDAKFFSTIGQMDSRASNTTWSINDAIGIYALNTGTTLAAANIYNSGENIQHITPLGDGAFSVATASEAIIFPANGDVLDFIAYYPYKATIASYIYPVDVSNQSNLELIDLLYSNNASGNKAAPTVALQFQHKLSKLIMNVSVGSGVTSLAGLTVSINDLNTQASFSLVDETLSGIGTPATLTPNVTIASDNLSATIEAILIPTQNINNAEIVFTLAGDTYTWTPGSRILLSEKKYTYAIEIAADALTATNPVGDINNWTEDNTDGPVTITPDGSTVITPTTTQLDFTTDAATSLPLLFDATDSWTIAADETWVTFSTAAGAAGTGISVTVDVTTNLGAARTANITISAGSETVTIPLTQVAANLATNLTTNGSFESFDSALPDGWITSGGGISVTKITSGAKDGSNAVKIASTSSTCQIKQTITGIEAGATYEVSFWYNENTKGAAAQGIRLWSAFQNSGGTAITPAIAELQPSTTLDAVTVWTEYKVTVTAPVGAVTFDFQIRVTNGNEGVIDNCSFVKL